MDNFLDINQQRPSALKGLTAEQLGGAGVQIGVVPARNLIILLSQPQPLLRFNYW
ncbi:hypothetical protein IVB22_21005 [Bradyrhizobium sp. 190]|uniref:hypothetical protein n=1 Tax=Bradyrhizobium sp. 190 TaxID=2782658 RepID=UPI001FF7541B|nr:hypothetical protein [Bradyrhizobium sp. 190]MCK1515002.1 hypothetical protein [Bradyrhizobium sp. 190]